MRQGTALFFGCLVLGIRVSTAAEVWTLERALDCALSKNPDAAIAAQRIAAAQAAVEQANASFWPRVQLQSSYSRTDNPMRAFGSILNQQAYKPSLNFNDVPDVDAFNARGMVTVPLYTGGRNAASRQAARANREVAREESAAVRNTLGYEVARAFHTIIKTRQILGAAEASIRSLESTLDHAKTLQTSGAQLKSDILSIEVRLAEAREDQIRARNAVALSTKALRHLLAVQDDAFVVADSAPSVAIPKPEQALERPELTAAQQRSKAADALLRNAKGGYQPDISAFGSLDYDHGWVTRGEGRSYSAGVAAQWDLWDGYSTRSKTREARANLEAAREEERKLRLAVEFEVEQARLALDASKERLAVTAKTVEQAEESASLTRKRFSQGMALSLQVLDSETMLLTARVRRAESESDQNIAIAALRKALALPQLDSSSPAH